MTGQRYSSENKGRRKEKARRLPGFSYTFKRLSYAREARIKLDLFGLICRHTRKSDSSVPTMF